MVATLLAYLAFAGAPATLDLVPTDDIWVYPHATDPQKDPFLRIWGAEGNAVALNPEEVQEFSYSYLKWDISSVPSDAKISAASLELTHVAGAGFTADYAKQHPLEARPLSVGFDEKTWQPDAAATLYPDKDAKTIFGSVFPDKVPTDDNPFPLSIDLLKGPKDFRQALKDALTSPTKQFALALTSSTSPEEMGSKAVYKVYSKDADKPEYRPRLHLVLE